MRDYQERIYTQYVNARTEPLAPPTIAGLQPRKALIDNIINKHFPKDKNARILDLGCGHGTILYFARKQGYTNLCGIDVSQEQVVAAHQLGIEEVQQGDLMETLRGLPDGSQDVVIAFDIIEHFTRSELLPFVDEVHRVLAPEGRWIIHCPNGESPFHGRVYFGDFTHEHAFTRTSINQLLRSSGYSRIECFEDEPISHGLKSLARRIIWKSGRALLQLYLSAESGATSKTTILSQNFLTVAYK